MASSSTRRASQSARSAVDDGDAALLSWPTSSAARAASSASSMANNSPAWPSARVGRRRRRARRRAQRLRDDCWRRRSTATTAWRRRRSSALARWRRRALPPARPSSVGGVSATRGGDGEGDTDPRNGAARTAADAVAAARRHVAQQHAKMICAPTRRQRASVALAARETNRCAPCDRAGDKNEGRQSITIKSNQIKSTTLARTHARTTVSAAKARA